MPKHRTQAHFSALIMHLRILLNSNEFKDMLLILGTSEEGNSTVKSVWKTSVCFTKKALTF